MADDVVSAPLGEVRQASTADTGTALTTTATYTSLFRGTNWIRMVPRNVVTAVVVKYAFNPWLTVLKTTDGLATVAALTDGSENVQDNNTSTTLAMGSFKTLATGGRLYVGFPVWVRGVRVIVDNTNTTAGTVLTVKYWKSATPNAWASISATDGTSSTDTLRQTGNVTWTVPTDGLMRSLNDIIKDQEDVTRSGGAVTAESAIAANSRPGIFGIPLYWTRWETDVTFTDASVTITGMQAMSRSTVYDALEISLGMAQRVNRGLGGIGCIEHLTDAGTANLIISCGVLGASGKFVD